MNCPTCGYKMAPTELDCPRCIKFALPKDSLPQASDTSQRLPTAETLSNTSSVPGLLEAGVHKTDEKLGTPLSEPVASRVQQSQLGRSRAFKPTWFDYLMHVLTVLAIIGEHGLSKLVGCFYVLLALAYVIDWGMNGMKKLRGGVQN